MSVASFDLRHAAMTWLGIGNVAGVLVHESTAGGRRQESLLLRGGVVGCRLPPMHARTLQLADHDTVVLATNGVRTDFDHGIWLGDSPQRMADRIMAVHGMTTDDALVLVVQLLADRP
jgi:negative regulator of sigma-B (phosphoserine phosphatase)